MLITAFSPRAISGKSLPIVFCEGTDTKTMFMPASVLQAWVVALRSGKFKPGIFFMSNLETTCFCPLGILQMAVDGEVEKKPDGTFMVLPTQAWLDKRFIEFRLPAGVEPINPYNRTEVVIPYLTSVQMFLTTLNDRYDITQYQMADIIEDHTEIVEP